MYNFSSTAGIQEVVVLVNEKLARLDMLAEEEYDALGIQSYKDLQAASTAVKRRYEEIEDECYTLKVEIGKILLAASEVLGSEQLIAFQEALYFPGGIALNNFDWRYFCDCGSGLVGRYLEVWNQIINNWEKGSTIWGQTKTER
jgi:hypothetical protein